MFYLPLVYLVLTLHEPATVLEQAFICSGINDSPDLVTEYSHYHMDGSKHVLQIYKTNCFTL